MITYFLNLKFNLKLKLLEESNNTLLYLLVLPELYHTKANYAEY